MYCRNCGKELPVDSKFCSNCGMSQPGSIPSETYEINKQEQRLKSLSQPIEKTFKINRKNKSQTILVVITVFIAFSIFIDIMSSETPISEPVMTETPVQIIMNETGFSETQAQVIESTLSEIGVTDIKSIEFFDELDSGVRCYEVTNSEVPIMLYLWQDGVIDQIYIESRGAQLYGNGQVMYEISDFIMSSSEQADAKTISEVLVLSILTAPSTAKFSGFFDWRYGRNEGVTTVQAYVDSQNGFGAMVRSNFQIKFDKYYNVISFIFDGEELIK